jgi:hypothetical protein
MVDMIATKRLRYGTRRLSAGDPFEARHDRDARLLVGIGKARYATRMMVADDEPVVARSALTTPGDGLKLVGERGPDLVDLPSGSKDDPAETPAEADDRPALRAEYEAKFGKRAFPGWSAEILREKLAAG